ncbi:hypothetical protein AB205_0180590 [Aquarana catesbeiana]|uniref:Uncharacterized protein n=1 Tax=Aquarana catesbeiana TaxID=8400 RepID=A0A2G9QGS6_AQUCT|nr:hypothetical protein AB205_0180590 [Aquarana catesbeiana]
MLKLISTINPLPTKATCALTFFFFSKMVSKQHNDITTHIAWYVTQSGTKTHVRDSNSPMPSCGGKPEGNPLINKHINTVIPWITSIIHSRRMLESQSTRISKSFPIGNIGDSDNPFHSHCLSMQHHMWPEVRGPRRRSGTEHIRASQKRNTKPEYCILTAGALLSKYTDQYCSYWQVLIKCWFFSMTI